MEDSKPSGIAVKTDLISIVEAAYDCESTQRGWFRRLLDHAGPRLDRGFGVAISTYTPDMNPQDATFDIYLGSAADTQEVFAASQAMIAAYPEIFHRVLTQGGRYQTASQVLGFTERQTRTWAPYVEHLHPLGVRDIVGFLARDPTGHALFLSAPQAETKRPSGRDAHLWNRIAVHLCAGARLRRALPGTTLGDSASAAEAVLSPSGVVTHAELPAQTTEARESLRVAARAIDRARSKARRNEDEALELWRGLVAGRWSLVEQFDSDGRRFMIARKNDPALPDPRALTIRERQVLAYVAMGHSIKLIAYSLGISPSSVSINRRTAMRKLGLRSPADVVRAFAPPARLDCSEAG